MKMLQTYIKKSVGSNNQMSRPEQSDESAQTTNRAGWNDPLSRVAFTILLLLVVCGTAMADGGVVVKGNVYGGGNAADVGGNATVNISAGQIGEGTADDNHGNVFGGGQGKTTTVVGKVEVNIGKKTVEETDISYSGNGMVKGSVYGGSALGAVNGTKADNWDEDNLDRISATTTITNTTQVNIYAGTVSEDVYGGGRGASAVRTEGQDGYVAPIAANVYGAVTVTVEGGTARNVFGCNNLNGSPQHDVTVNIAGGTIQENVFGGGNQAAYAGSPTVTMSGGKAANVYGGGLGSTAVVAGTSVTLSGTGTVTHDVYGGGSLADVTGGVAVNITGGSASAVYGGGAKAHTNTSNWASDYTEFTGLTDGEPLVNGLYTLSGDSYSEITTEGVKAVAETKYYTINNWTSTQKSALYKTTVKLTGGNVGDVYGGGLGEGSGDTGTPAYVWGDLLVDLNGETTYDTGGNAQTTPITGIGCIVNQVFGCNNVNGTPKGEVLVHVHATQKSGESSVSTKATKGTDTYDVQAVYGGGNQAEYWPVAAKANGADETETNHIHTNVIIDGCTLSSIGTVYGGGNAASTPSTCVTVNGAYEINEVFGGGNGKDAIDEYTPNPGAHVGFHKYNHDAAETSDDHKSKQKYGFGKAQVNVGGGTIHSVFGGSNSKGNVREVAIAMLDKQDETCTFAVGEAYGGGKSAEMDGRAVLQLGCVPSIDEVYGGAESASIHNDVELTITNGTYKRIFGGNNKSGSIDGKITINVEETGCTPIVIGQIFAGGNEAAYTTPSGKDDPVINVKSFTSIGEIYGGGFGQTAVLTGNPIININEIVGDKATAYTETTFKYDNGTEDTSDDYTVIVPAHTTANTIGTIGDVYGGGYGADVVGNVTVNIGTQEKIEFETTPVREGITADENRKYTVAGVDIARNVYGGGYGANTTVTGNVEVNIGGEKNGDGGTTYIGGNIAIGGNVYGGSALGAVNATRDDTQLKQTTDATTMVTLKKGTVSKAVFGGGQGDDNTQAKVYGKAVVNFYGDVIAEGLYGGCDANGRMFSGTELNLMGGRIGDAFTAVPNTGVPEIVFGGGLGANTIVDGTVTVNVGSATGGSTIYSNVYGGSKKGSVAVANVNLLGGTIWGNVFGGGYSTADEKTAATDVTVTLDGTKLECLYSGIGDERVPQTGQIFGCNNLQGSPTGHVKVEVKKTVGSDKSSTEALKKTRNERTTYDVAAVYGGGNQADYVPTANNENTEVIIEGCEKTSIKDVYGGGNAAAVPATSVLVKGSYIIDRVFGGGNGYGSDNPGADVGVIDPEAYKANHQNGIYGTGTAVTKLLGGYINSVFGGSNSKGDIAGGTDVKTKNATDDITDCCENLIIGGIYGAGSNADMAGDVNIVLDCMPEDYVGEVYGGAMNANIDGNVSLTVTSGKFGRVFGGNNSGGSINGSITVNINEGGCKPLEIGELFGAGNAAPYSVFGCEKVDGKWVAKTSGTRYVPEGTDAVKVNVLACTSIGKVFGGGFGQTAEVIGDTHVDINMMKGYVNDEEQEIIGRIGQVFGGGSAANVTGSTKIDIGTATVYSNQENGVNITKTKGESDSDEYNNTKYLDPDNNSYISLDGGVYGGGEAADVYGNTTLNIGTVDQKLGINITGNIFGGGYGNTTKVTGDVVVNIGKKEGNDTNGYTFAGFANITGDVYGGSAMGTVNAYENEEMVLTASEGKTTKVNLYGGTITGNLYGGGYGLEGEQADVYGPVTVTVEGGKAQNVYGCNNLKGEPQSTVNVTINNTDKETGNDNNMVTAIGNVFGGGNHADYTRGTPEVLMAGGYVNNIYGGGDNADVAKNTSVTMTGGYVHNRIFGGGNLGSVGVYTTTVPEGHSHDGDCIKKPTTCTSGGTCNVTISGGRVGPTGMTMPEGYGYVFGASRGETEDPDVDPDINFRTYVNETHVTINGTAFITGGVYGGSENGRVLKDTYVTIDGDCQIGCGKGKTQVYTTDEWSSGDPLAPTAHWPYENPWTPYDEHAYDENTASNKGTDGHTFYGNVFGGGSGYFPYLKKKTSDSDPDEYEWLPSAGLVEGDTHLTISGGHILTNVYGGNEMTDVSGTCHVTMTGGTIGVPRTVIDIQGHPVISNLFGAGKGDQRVHFNKRTNVDNTEVSVTGGTIYGSIFGGGEDGHVMKNTKVTVGGDALIGTWGYSGFDGNVFGGGRGFSGDALTAGNVGGTVELNIEENAQVLGSVYGGGRLASVGYGLYNVDETDYYGVIRDDGKDDAGNTVEGFKRGYVTVNIKGGTIGNDTESTLTHTKGGNVYGGSMGRLTLLDGSINDLWPKLAKVKEATVNISGGTIKANVYGGGELGTVTTNTKVEVTGGTVNRDLFGGGYGSNDYTTTTDGYTPMQLAGRVDGTTTVEVKGGWVKKNVYGGGEMASVGIMTLGSQHTDETPSFALSWPYASSYANNSNGNTDVTISGGRIGITGKDKMGNYELDEYGNYVYEKDENGDIQTDSVGNPIKSIVKEDNGDVYGAGKGLAGDRYIYANCANVNNSTVSIEYTNGTTDPTVATDESGKGDCIAGSVYGGGENGHVIGNTRLTMGGGLVGHALYGGGKGKDTYSATYGNETKSIYSITAGKVYGNTYVTMSGGRVVRNIYGGGNMASVGKGNYSGGSDDYSTAGYGEMLTGSLWTNTHFMNSGKSTVTISGGTVGAVQTELNGKDDMKDDLIFGNVFGGCRGVAAPNAEQTLSPRFFHYNEFFAGYVNETQVNINGGNVLGSVYGGGEDGHVRRGTQVNINGGEIGLAYTEANQNYVGKNNKGNPYKISSDRWQQRGNVYGSGSGIGQYDTGEVEIVDEKEKAIMAYSYSAGSVTQSTEVNIKGGTVYKDVYGGGSLSTVGPPKIGQTTEPTKAQSLNKVTIDGGTVGEATGYASGYGGNVYGASRGYSDFNLDQTVFTTTMFTEVNMKSGSVIGSLFGGGEVGIVKRGVEVNVTGGTVGHDVYGGGALANTNTNNWGTDIWATGMTSASNTTTVALKGGTVKGNAYGGGLGSADVAAKVYGDVLVKLNEPETTTMTTGEGEGATTTTTTTYGDCEVHGAIFGCNNLNGSPQGDVTVHIYKTQGWTEGTGSSAVSHDVSAGKNDYTVAKGTGVYELSAVYGGGNLAAYYPDDATTRAAATTNVIIDGCDLTSIGTVYGGGNAASVPATEVVVNSAYEIGEVYGGGNGKDNYELDGKWYENPGANVGYKDYTHTGTGTGTEADPILAEDNTAPDASTPENRIANYAYGTGKAHATVNGGTVHALYGGSNTKGNIRVESRATLEDREDCPFNVGEAYGGGHNAPQDGDAVLEIGCISGLGKAYGGAANADVNGDVVLNITNGTYGQVFGGNDEGGCIRGSITVNIEETGCRPIIIGELYAGGNEAAYSVYGYNADGSVKETGDNPVADPVVNVHSFTSIGTIYGGGYGSTATMVGNPTVNINVYEGKYYNVESGRGSSVINNNAKVVGSAVAYSGTGYDSGFPIPSHEKGKIGAINTVFGGGNAAKVIGNPTVNIGTEAGDEVYAEVAVATGADVTGLYTRSGEGTTASPYTYTEITTTTTADASTTYYKKTVKAVDIRGNVFGGGNNAEVTGDTNVVIGAKKTE